MRITKCKVNRLIKKINKFEKDEKIKQDAIRMLKTYIKYMEYMDEFQQYKVNRLIKKINKFEKDEKIKQDAIRMLKTYIKYMDEFQQYEDIIINVEKTYNNIEDNNNETGFYNVLGWGGCSIFSIALALFVFDSIIFRCLFMVIGGYSLTTCIAWAVISYYGNIKKTKEMIREMKKRK